MRVGVTAASGQLGGAIVRALKRRGDVEVVGVARTPVKASGLGVEVRAGDYDDEAQMTKALRGLDAALMVSSMAPAEPRLEQHRHVIDAAKNAGVRHFVYTGIVCHQDAGGDFTAIQEQSRATEALIRGSGMTWSIGRDGIYIEPDLEYLPEYLRTGTITNSGGTGRCLYTTRDELAEAYVHLLVDPRHVGKTYDLGGPAITQDELTRAINEVYGTSLAYAPMSIEDYRKDRDAELGGWLAGVIAGIYEGIQRGAFDVVSPYDSIVGRPHQTLHEMIERYKTEHAR